MSDYSFTDGSPAAAARFIASYLEVLKEDDPILHEKIVSKQREIMKGIVQDSGDGPTFLELIKDVLQQSDEKRFYEAVERLEK